MKIILSLHENNSIKRISSSLYHTVWLLSKQGGKRHQKTYKECLGSQRIRQTTLNRNH